MPNRRGRRAIPNRALAAVGVARTCVSHSDIPRSSHCGVVAPIRHSVQVTETSDEWRWNRLREALTVLAADPVEQLNWIGEAHTDELALNFDDARGLVLGLTSPPPLRADLLDVIETIDSELDSMSGSSNAELWTPQAVRESERWTLVRDLAGRAVSMWSDHA